jgi:hypothetical protein
VTWARQEAVALVREDLVEWPFWISRRLKIHLE